jgi:hypothetical protein
MHEPEPARRVLLGLALVCAGNLLLEIVLTRIFSALMYYHFTFFAIAMALLGVGASGVYVYVRADRFPADRVDEDLAFYARWFAPAALAALAYVLANPIEIVSEASQARFTNRTLWQLAWLCAFTALPFFLAGVVVALAITHYRARVDRVYAFDLAGAGLGAVSVGWLLGALSGPGVVALVAVLGCAGAVCFAPGRRSLAAAGGSLAVLALGLGTSLFELPSVKEVRAERVIYEGWNTFSRVTLERMDGGALDLRIDASARTRVVRPELASGDAWREDLRALAHAAREGRGGEVLVIGSGGGIDVANALAAGARRVTAIEVNPLIPAAIARFAPEVDLYRDPRVTLAVDEGRSFVRRSPHRYDVIQATLVDTWAATSAGAFALTETALYTVEAFADYFDHLTEDGMLTMSRWQTPESPESVRVAVLAAAALEARGVRPAQVRHHLFLARKGILATLVAKARPFTEVELASLHGASEANGFEVLLSPKLPARKGLPGLLREGAWSRAVREYPKDITPPSDDRPFFFYFAKPGSLGDVAARLRWGASLSDPALWLLAALGGLLVAMTGLFVFAPLLLRRWRDLAGGGPGALPRRLAGLVYFGWVGLGFIVVEIALMQRLALFLGHPSYGLIAVLFGLLVGTALGARLSGRIGDGAAGKAAAAAGGAVAALVAATGLALAEVLRALMPWPLAGRLALSVAVVLGFGVAMGLMLPLGVRLVSRRDAALLPWAWGVNGGTSVLGTVAATLIAIHQGFTAAFLAGSALYAGAGATGFALARLVARPGPP